MRPVLLCLTLLVACCYVGVWATAGARHVIPPRLHHLLDSSEAHRLVRYPTHFAAERDGESHHIPVPDAHVFTHFREWLAEAHQFYQENVASRSAGVCGLQSSNALCPNNSYYEFIPQYRATVMGGNSVSWTGDCYNHITASLQTTDAGATVTITVAGASDGLLCAEDIMLATRERLYFKQLAVGFNPHVLHIYEWEAHEQEDVAKNGLRIYQLPCGLIGSAESIEKTMQLFVGKDLQQVNADFLRYKMRWDIAAQPFGRQVPIDESAIRSGDYLAIMRLDGLDPLIMFGTGGYTGHSAVAVWEGSTLYVCESTDANPFGPVYWPPPYGIIRTPFKQWYAQAINASYHVAVLPLRADLAAQFNETRAWQWFSTVQGMPYGYHNMLYSFMDTHPNANMPFPIDDDEIQIVFSVLDRYVSNSSKTNVYSMIIQAMNMRLNADCQDMVCLNALLDQQGLSFVEVMSRPEQDAWRYPDGYSMVCSVFAFQMWKAGLGTALPDIQGTEQTPKDNYMAQMFDPQRFTDAECPGGLTPTPHGAYCQILGPYVLVLPGYNSVPLYAHMNERCAAQWPTYDRCPADNPQCC